MRSLVSMSLAALVGCTGSLGGGTSPSRGPEASGSSSLALVSSTGESSLLRRGETLSLALMDVGVLDPGRIYRAQVMIHDRVVSESDVLSDGDGRVLRSAIMHDVGEHGDAYPGDELMVRILDARGVVAAQTPVELSAPALMQRGWAVDEVAPPHIYASDVDGAAQNGFAVGGLGEGEVGGPVHVTGDGFPEEVAGREVDIYVARDADEWRGTRMPTEGDADWVAGPIAVRVSEDGRLPPTAVFTPDLADVGVYDLLVDVDRDGRFEWSFGAKDGADGLQKVGFTVQYSEAWLRERTSRHLLVNIAYDSHDRNGGVWRNEFAADEPVFLYLNPPVMHRYHFEVTKWIVAHQDFETFWNNPAVANADGDVCFAEHETISMAIVTETGCTNTSPTCFGIPDFTGAHEDGAETASFDVVFDRNGDGCYTPGEDLLDVVGAGTHGDLVSVEDLLRMPPEQRVGFVVDLR